MKKVNSSTTVVLLTCLSLGIPFFTTLLVNERPSAASTLHSDKPNKESSDLREQAAQSQTDGTLRVILQLKAPMSSQLRALLNSSGGRVKSNFKNLNAQSLEIPANILDIVAAFDEVLFISPNRETGSLGHLSATTGADMLRPFARE